MGPNRLGLLRWPSTHWELALFHRTADAPQREAVGAIFNALNSYLGNYIGEFLGEGLMHGFLFLTAMAMLKSAAFPRWMGWTGIVISGLSLVGVFRNVNGFAESIQDLENMLMLFPISLVILGIGLARFAVFPHCSGGKDHSLVSAGFAHPDGPPNGIDYGNGNGVPERHSA